MTKILNMGKVKKLEPWQKRVVLGLKCPKVLLKKEINIYILLVSCCNSVMQGNTMRIYLMSWEVREDEKKF